MSLVAELIQREGSVRRNRCLRDPGPARLRCFSSYSFLFLLRLVFSCCAGFALLSHLTQHVSLQNPKGPPVYLFMGANAGAVCYNGGDPLTMTPPQAPDGQYSCGEGFHCPNFVPTDNSTWPVYCTPKPECLIQRAFGEQCAPSSDQEPVVCQPGTYCPDATEILECPSGYYCTFATAKPIKCPALSYCPAGTSKLLFFGGALASILLAILFILCLVVYRTYLRYSTLNDNYDEATRFLDAIRGPGSQDESNFPNESVSAGADRDKNPPASDGEHEDDVETNEITPVNDGEGPRDQAALIEAGGGNNSVTSSPTADGNKNKKNKPSDGGKGDQKQQRGNEDGNTQSTSVSSTSPPSSTAAVSLTSSQQKAADAEAANAKKKKAVQILAGGFLLARSTKPLTYEIRDVFVWAPMSKASSQKGNMYGKLAEEKKAKEREEKKELLAVVAENNGNDAAEADTREAERIREEKANAEEGCCAIPSFVPFCGTPKERIPILQGVTATFSPSTVTAILGPGGCGKSTLMNALLGRLPAGWTREGYIAVNGDDSPEVTERLKGVIGSATQAEPLHKELTVYQNLFYTSQVRLPSSWSNQERDIFLAATIEALGLIKQKDIPIGDEESRGVSGGQRRRCHIGIEIASAPYALFLDEPTNGLDATTALEVCSCLSTIATGAGLTVIMTISQPRIEIWNALDNIIVIAKGGRTVYQGSRADSKRFFEEVFEVEFNTNGNPSDTIVDAVAADGPALADMWHEYSQDPEAFLNKKATEKRDKTKVVLKDGPRGAKVLDKEGADKIIENAFENAEDGREPAVAQTEDDHDKVVEGYIAAAHVSGQPYGGASESGDVPAISADGQGGDGSHTLWPRVVGDDASRNRRQQQQHNNEPFSAITPSSPPDAVGGGAVPSTKKDSPQPNNAPNDGPDEKESKTDTAKELGLCCNRAPKAPNQIVITRRNASFPHQVWIVFRRSLAKQLSDLQPLIVEQTVNIVVSSAIGISSINYEPYWEYKWYPLISPPIDELLPQVIMYLCMALGVVCVMPGSAIFVNCRQSYFRESSAGFNRLAFYLGTVLSLQPRIVLTSCVFTTLFLLIPRIAVTWLRVFGAVWFVASCSYVLGIIPAMMFSPASAPLVGTLCSIFFSCLSGFILKFPVGLKYISYAYWASSMLQRFFQRPVAHAYADLASQGEWISDDIGLCVGILFVILAIFHTFAFSAMVFFDREKQR